MSRPQRVKAVATNLTRREHSILCEMARRNNATVGTWVRIVLRTSMVEEGWDPNGFDSSDPVLFNVAADGTFRVGEPLLPHARKVGVA